MRKDQDDKGGDNMAFLKVMSGNLKGLSCEIDQDEIYIGRSSAATFQVNDASVSGKHCMIRRDDGRFTVYDLGSTNGTRLNNVSIKEYRLNPKDILAIGSVEMIFDGEDVEADPLAAMPSTITQVIERPSVGIDSAIIGRTAPFNTRRDNKWMWVVALSIMGGMTVAVLIWFLIQLFRG